MAADGVCRSLTMLLQIPFLGRSGEQGAHTAEERIVTVGCGETSSMCYHARLVREHGYVKITVK